MISNKCQNILQIAYDEALKSHCLHKHGCVACINGKIISRGYNNYNTWSSSNTVAYTFQQTVSNPAFPLCTNHQNCLKY